MCLILWPSRLIANVADLRILRLSTFTTSEREHLFSTLIRILEHYLVFSFSDWHFLLIGITPLSIPLISSTDTSLLSACFTLYLVVFSFPYLPLFGMLFRLVV